MFMQISVLVNTFGSVGVAKINGVNVLATMIAGAKSPTEKAWFDPTVFAKEPQFEERILSRINYDYVSAQSTSKKMPCFLDPF